MRSDASSGNRALSFAPKGIRSARWRARNPRPMSAAPPTAPGSCGFQADSERFRSVPRTRLEIWDTLGSRAVNELMAALDQTTRRGAMNKSVTKFVEARAMVGRNLSGWRQIIDAVIEGPPRTAAH